MKDQTKKEYNPMKGKTKEKYNAKAKKTFKTKKNLFCFQTTISESFDLIKDNFIDFSITDKLVEVHI